MLMNWPIAPCDRCVNALRACGAADSFDRFAGAGVNPDVLVAQGCALGEDPSPDDGTFRAKDLAVFQVQAERPAWEAVFPEISFAAVFEDDGERLGAVQQLEGLTGSPIG
jgi:hypothetical protein